jgi:hypothetical protein
MKTYALSALLGLLLLGCLAPGPNEEGGGGATSGVGLYAYDQNSKSVMVWKDLSAAFDGDAALTTSLTLTSGEFSNLDSLALGGMAFDASRNQLYLVNDNGKVVRVSRARSQTGSISTTDALTFNLDSSNRLTNSKFGQAAMDTAANVLYVTETGDNGTRIWAVASPNQRSANEQVTLTAVQVSTGGGGADSDGFGVAAASGAIYGSFAGGATVTVGGINYSGARMRKGDSTGFSANSRVLIGPNTLLGKYGVLGLDTTSGILYCGVHLTSAGLTGGSPVLAFDISKFSGAPDVAPSFVLGDASTMTTLRFLSHAGSKDWLVGGAESGTTLWMWKQPSASGGTMKQKSAPGGAVFRAVALDSNG